MTSKKVIRYYCDHCRKGGFRKPDMESHEASCVRNANRKCFVCEAKQDVAAFAKPIIEGTEYDLGKLRAQCQGCPACMLAVILVVHDKLREFVFYNPSDEREPINPNHFDYKNEKERWRKEEAEAWDGGRFT